MGDIMKNEVTLTYLQTMIFSYRIEEMKNENPFFFDGIAKQYQEYVINRSSEIVCTYPQFLLKLKPNGDKYVISQSMFDYLSHLTGVNPCDKKVMKFYKPIIKEVQEKAFAEVLGDFEIHSNKVHKK